MAGSLTIVGIALIIGWGVWWWLLRGHQQGTADLLRRVEDLEKQYEPQ
jgi:hypothetical protein